MNVELERLSILQQQPGQQVLGIGEKKKQKSGRRASLVVEVSFGSPDMAPGEGGSGKDELSSSSQAIKPHAAAPGTTSAGPAVARIADWTSSARQNSEIKTAAPKMNNP
jgi:hypothetical protein